MNQCIYEGKAKEVEQMTKDALAEGRHFKEVLEQGLIAGMSVVGEDFKHNILYVPEVLISARAMKAGMAVLKPLLTAGGGADTSSTGRILMGTVRGDLHDIGKNLVCMMAEGAGFVVKDIGVDQSVEKFQAAADEFKPDIIGMSALLTTTMTYMKTVIDGCEKPGYDHIKMAIGGAPISQMFADEIGADGYGADASSAVDLFLYLVGKGPAPKATLLYWRELPSAVKVWDDFGEVKMDLPAKFADRIDATAQKLGLTSGDAYTAELHWGEEKERPGVPEDVAKALVQELDKGVS
jgi:5-methyltetrahydrofolate--homocysteine methyltransferase